MEDERQMKSAKRGSKREQTHKRMTHRWYDAHKHLEPMSCDRFLHVCVNTRKR